MSNNNQNTRGFAGKGYYIALILCAAAIGISGYLYYRNMNDPVSTQVDTTTPDVVVGITDDADIPAIATQSTDTAPTEPSQQATVPQDKTFQKGRPWRSMPWTA